MTDRRPHWAIYFIRIAEAVAERTDCRRARVGAVIVDTRNRIVSTGYPGTQAGEPGCLDGACPRGQLTAEQCAPGSPYDNCISVHAEANALLYSDRSRHDGGTMYITREPCHACTKLLQGSGLAHAIHADPTGRLHLINLVPTTARVVHG